MLDKVIDKKVIHYLFNYYIDKFDLRNYCKFIDFSTNENAYAYYSAYEKMIVLNLELMIDEFMDVCDFYNFRGKDYYGYINLKIIQYLLHEIEHVKQDKYCGEDFEGLLLMCAKINMDLWELMRDDKKYKQTYIYNPSERMADINSYSRVLSIMRLFGFSGDFYGLINREYISSKIAGYGCEMCPSEVYFCETGMENVWKGMTFYCNDRSIMYKMVSLKYNLEERLYYGLPIDSKEFKKMSLLLNKNVI